MELRCTSQWSGRGSHFDDLVCSGSVLLCHVESDDGFRFWFRTMLRWKIVDEYQAKISANMQQIAQLNLPASAVSHSDNMI